MLVRPVRLVASGVVVLLSLAAARAPSVHAQVSCREVAISRPFGGEAVRGIVPILGSARIDGFGFYKVEWASAAEPDDWKAVSETYATPVVHGLLDSWDTTRRPDGPYRLRLVVVDQTGQEPCRQVLEGVLVESDEREGAIATSTITPTVEIRAARPGEMPPPSERSVAAAGPDTGRADEAPGEAAAATGTPTSSLQSDLSRLVRPDHPVELVHPEDEAAATAEASAASRNLDVLDPESLASAVDLRSWPVAFAAGAVAAVLLATFLLILVGLRRPR